MLYNAMVIDGGGLYGIIPITLINRINERIPKFIESTNIFIGTSVGGIISLYLAANKNPKDGIEIFSKHASNIFKYNLWRRLNSWRIAKYSNTGLYELMHSQFGDMRLGDLNFAVMIPTVVTDTGMVKWFDSSTRSSADLRVKVVDVAMAASAVPTYFPSWHINGIGNCVDAGICTNNPVLSALARLDMIDHIKHSRDIDLFNVISFGTGKYDIRYGFGDIGISQVIKYIIHLAANADNEDIVEASMHELKNRYIRINPRLSRYYNMDDHTVVDDIVKEIDHFDIVNAVEWVNENWV